MIMMMMLKTKFLTLESRVSSDDNDDDVEDQISYLGESVSSDDNDDDVEGQISYLGESSEFR